MSNSARATSSSADSPDSYIGENFFVFLSATLHVYIDVQ